jgi:hypothetical protein
MITMDSAFPVPLTRSNQEVKVRDREDEPKKYACSPNP